MDVIQHTALDYPGISAFQSHTVCTSLKYVFCYQQSVDLLGEFDFRLFHTTKH